ncbi:Hsp20/alpha crystallin family protein [bacterium]|nr:Hsp20/alpha crystallin family protein [bacterium]
MALTRWEPMGVRTLRDQINRMFEDVMTPALRGGFGLMGPALDVYEKDGEVFIEAELPGMDIKDVEITSTENTLTLKGETTRETEVKEENFHRAERRFGSFVRTVELPSPINPEQARASFKDGVLTIHAPLAAGATPKRISVEGEQARGELPRTEQPQGEPPKNEQIPMS